MSNKQIGGIVLAALAVGLMLILRDTFCINFGGYWLCASSKANVFSHVDVSFSDGTMIGLMILVAVAVWSACVWDYSKLVANQKLWFESKASESAPKEPAPKKALPKGEATSILELRIGASTANPVIHEVPLGATIEILGGPVISGGEVWMRVSHDGVAGWTTGSISR